MNATRRKAEPQTVPLRTITAATSVGVYRPSWTPARPGAQDHEKYPSKQGPDLVYRDGRRVKA